MGAEQLTKKEASELRSKSLKNKITNENLNNFTKVFNEVNNNLSNYHRKFTLKDNNGFEVFLPQEVYNKVCKILEDENLL